MVKNQAMADALERFGELQGPVLLVGQRCIITGFSTSLIPSDLETWVFYFIILINLFFL